MPRALEIPIEVTRLDRAQDSVRRLSESVRGVGRASRSSAEDLKDSWSRAIEKISRDQAKYLTISGPAQRLRRAVAAREAAVASGDEARIFDADTAVRRAQEAVRREREAREPAKERTTLDRFTTALRSTRFGAGPVAPLIGRTADVLGIPTTGVAGLAVGGATAAAAALAVALKAATENLNEFGAAMRLSGGTARDVAGIARYGFRGEAGANAAEQFRQRIATDPMAQMFAARMGIRAVPEPFGTVNNAQFLRRAVEGLRGMADAEERLRAARVLGLESALKYLDVSPEMNRVLDEQAKLEEQIASSGAARSANDLSVGLDALTQSLKDLAAITLSTNIAATTRNLGKTAQELQALETGNLVEFFRLFFGGAPAGSNATDKNTDAVEANTQAHKESTDAFKDFQFQQGGYGGGRNAAGAMPTGWSGDYLARNMEAGALGRGARVV